MAREAEVLRTPLKDSIVVSQASSPLPLPKGFPPLSKMPMCPKEYILAVAAGICAQPPPNCNPDVWGILTAISIKARKRRQGINMLLTGDEHCLGRLVEDIHFRIESNAVSGSHCKIYRKQIAAGGVEDPPKFISVFLKDTSTNGTFLNWEKLDKNSPEVKVLNGDIISFVAPPQTDLALAFVYQEVIRTESSIDGATLKRKLGDNNFENKRQKGIGIGAHKGPISLDDFRSFQRSNMELRKQLESHAVTIDALRNENRSTTEHYENKMKELRESIVKPYIGQITELQQHLDVKQNELSNVNKILSDQKHALHGLNERLRASMQSCTEANDLISSQKASISELKTQLDGERDQRREEREKAVAVLKATIQKVQSVAQEELRQLSEASSIREREQQEVINKLQDLEKERCLLEETLRTKLEEAREKMVTSDNKVHQLEIQLHEELQISASGKKKIEELEHEVTRLKQELDDEKAAREEAWTKVSALELEIDAMLHDLDFERRKLKGARERIMLRETQLRAFYSTTEEISSLFAKQQEQLKSMQKALEDEENYESTSVDFDLNIIPKEKEAAVATATCQSISTTKQASFTSPTLQRNPDPPSSDSSSATENHECCAPKSQDKRIEHIDDDVQDTEEVEFGGKVGLNTISGLGFGSDFGCGGTERVLESEEQRVLRVDEDTHVQCTEERENCVEVLKSVEGTEPVGTLKTADLLASEVAGSWVCSTAPSVHGLVDSNLKGGSPKGGSCNGSSGSDTEGYSHTDNGLLEGKYVSATNDDDDDDDNVEYSIDCPKGKLQKWGLRRRRTSMKNVGKI